MKDRSVFVDVLKLMIPSWGRLIFIIGISLLHTGASLIEPLIYREAINDIAGIFVQDARNQALEETGDNPETPITSFVEKTISAKTDSSGTAPNRIAGKAPHRRGHVAGRTPAQAINTLMWSVAILFVASVVGYALRWTADNMSVRLSCGIEQRFIYKTYDHVLRMPLDFFAKRSSAALTKQINQEDQLYTIVNGISQQILPEVISLIGIVVIMLTQNISLTLIAFSIIPLYLFIAVRSANKLESGLSRYYEQWEGISTCIQDSLTGIKTVKLSGAEGREASRLKALTEDAYNDYVKRSMLADKFIFFQSLLTRTSTAFVLAYGGYLTLERRLTPGDVVMFVAYLDRLYAPIDTLTALWVQLQQNLASLARAFKLNTYKAEETKKNRVVIDPGRVEFRDVHFGYLPGRQVLKGISFIAEPGKVTAIVGNSGAGKTTTVDLLLKLYEPQAGEILIDGNNIANSDTASVRQQIGMVAADGAIFRGSLADNIRYKRPDASDEEVEAAALAAGMERTIQRLPDHLASEIGEGGLGLSVGEKQRLQIARILVAKPRILILDEATANLDFATEAEVIATVNLIKRNHTVIIIAHRYSMVRDADYVVVLSDGKILEQGTTGELLKKNQWYADFALSGQTEMQQVKTR